MTLGKTQKLVLLVLLWSTTVEAVEQKQEELGTAKEDNSKKLNDETDAEWVILLKPVEATLQTLLVTLDTLTEKDLKDLKPEKSRLDVDLQSLNDFKVKTKTTFEDARTKLENKGKLLAAQAAQICGIKDKMHLMQNKKNAGDAVNVAELKSFKSTVDSLQKVDKAWETTICDSEQYLSYLARLMQSDKDLEEKDHQALRELLALVTLLQTPPVEDPNDKDNIKIVASVMFLNEWVEDDKEGKDKEWSEKATDTYLSIYTLLAKLVVAKGFPLGQVVINKSDIQEVTYGRIVNDIQEGPSWLSVARVLNKLMESNV